MTTQWIYNKRDLGNHTHIAGSIVAAARQNHTTMWVKVENRTTILGSMIPRAGEDYFPPLFRSIKAKTGRH